MIASLSANRLLKGQSARILNIALLVILALSLALFVAPKVMAHGVAYFLEIGILGIANGAIYALIALGYTMVYGIIELINFAHGDVFTLGGFISLPVIGLLGLTAATAPILLIGGLLLVFIVTMALTGLINVGIERVAYRPLRNSPRLAPLITAVGMSFLIEGVMYIVAGPQNIRYPDLLPAGQISLGNGVTVGVKDILVVVIAVLLVVLLTLFVSRSKLGKAMRATAQDRDAAQLMGIDINRTISATFFIGAALAAAGGMIFGLYFNTLTFDLGFSIGLFAFTAAVFGGIGNIQGAALGGLLIGLIRSFNDGYFASQWTDVIIFAVLILVLVFRPTGLLGSPVADKA